MAIGETLTSARTALGRTVDDVAEATRIRSTVIRSMEAEDFAPCGGSIYARGHLRSIAGVLGLDPVPLVAEFDRRHGCAPAPMTMPGLNRAASARVERRRPNWTAAMAAALVVVLVAGAVHLLRSPSGRPETVTAPQLTGTPAASPRLSAGPSRGPAPLPSDAVALVDPNMVTVQLRLPADKSWVSITSSTGVQLFQGVLTAGTSRVFRDAKQLRLILGNAGAVDLVVNGRDLGPAGAPGAVKRVVFNRGDPGASVG